MPFTGDEKQSLQVSLDRHRDAVLWKLEGLGDDDLRRAMTPSGTNLLGLVKHLAAVEYGWFCETFGRPIELELEATGTAWFGDAASMRWVLIHMIEETAGTPATSTSSASSSTG